MMPDAASRPKRGTDEVAELVARRLVQLGRDPRLVTPGAVAALRQHGGSGGAVHSVLAGALFLASTEDAPHVEASHVTRAASLRNEPPSPPEPVVLRQAAFVPAKAEAAPAIAKRARFDATNVLFSAVLAAEIAFVALRPIFGDNPQPASPPVVEGSKAPAVPAATPPPAAELPLPALRPPSPRPAEAPPVPAPRAQAPDVGAVTPSQAMELPLPALRPPSPQPAEPPAPAQPPRVRVPAATLPAAVAAHVIVTYSRNDPAGPARAAAISDALGRQGFSATESPEALQAGAASVSYFFSGDLAGAQRVGAILGGAWQANTRFARPAGPELPRPGSIRVSVPPIGQGPR